MDPSLLTEVALWSGPEIFAAGDFPGEIPAVPELRGHVLFETSGSSGEPKWIALKKSVLLESAAAVNRHLDVTHDSCWGLALPLRHVGGFGVMARAYEADCRFVHFNRRWDAGAFAAWLSDNEVTHLSLVPTQVHDLTVAGIHAPASLRAVVVGGGRLDQETGRAARALGWPVLASYGMTESASQIATQDFSALEHPYQPSPIPLLPIWRAETTGDQKLRIAGKALFSGILRTENAVWRFEPRCGEWHETSDRVLLEHDQLTPLGRSNMQVKVLGELVDVEEIEHELSVLSGGNFCPGSFVVVAVADPRLEHRLVPVFDASLDDAVIDKTLAAYAEKALGFRRLCPPVRLDPLPRSPLGKPRRREIFEQITAGDRCSKK